MSDKIGGISLDDIMAASDDLLEEDSTPVQQPAPAATAQKATSGNTIGGVNLDAIMAAADVGLDDEEPDTVRKAEPVKNTDKVKKAEPEKKPESIKNIDSIKKTGSAGNADQERSTKPDNQSAAIRGIGGTAGTAERIDKFTPPEQDEEGIKFTPLDTGSSHETHIVADRDGHGGYSTLDEMEKPENGFVTAVKKTTVGAVFAEIFERKNFGLLFWTLLNMFIGSALTTVILVFFACPIFLAIPLSLVIYLLMLANSYTKRGEMGLRRSFGLIAWPEITKYYSDANPSRLASVHKAFEEVYEQARRKAPNIGEVELFLMDDDSINAFATGKRTIIMTKGMVNMPIGQIKAILGHEFGHLAHRDTEILLIPQTGNALFTRVVVVFAFLWKVVIGITEFIIGMFSSDNDNSFTGVRIISWIENFLTEKLLGWWMSLGTMICTRNNKDNEFAADRFSCELGYAQELKDAFLTMEDGSEIQGYFATLVSTHPATPERVMNINEYMTLGA